MKNLRDDIAFFKLASRILARADGAEIIFSPARGNWGDGLINIGTRQFLDFYHIPYGEVHKRDTRELLEDKFFAGKLVLIGGGGAWSRNFSLSRQEASAIAQQAKHVIVLPTTFDLPEVSASNVSYFTRDAYASLETISSASFCHDMAFFAEIDVLEPSSRAWKLFAMRSDREGLGYAKHFPLNIDLSMLGDGDYRYAEPFFNIINNFSVITTDRMHVAIASAMLGRRTHLIPGNYSKSLDVYRSSIEPNYPHVTICSIDEVLAWHTQGTAITSAT